MVYEAQIVLRRDSPERLVADFQAITSFIDRLNSGEQPPTLETPVDAVRAAERILNT